MRRIGLWLGVAATLSSCGGGGGGNGSSIAVVPSATPTPTAATPTPTASTGCTLAARQAFVDARMREWYLFPETLPASIDAGSYTSVQAYIDALTATARSQRRDRNFTYITSIAEENAFYASGQTAGFGIRLTYPGGAALVVSEAFEGTPALAAGIDRGTQITGIGTTTANIRSISDIVAAEGTAGINNALGPNTTGTARVLRFTPVGGTSREASVAKTDFEITPVSNRYGARILDDGGRRVGYLNLRTFISTANQQLRDAFATFRSAGVTEVVIDLRYNGGGLVSTAELFSNLLGANRSTSDVLSYTTFRPEKSANNETAFFQPQPQSIAPTKIAFIGTGGTASASELVINSMLPYLRANAGLVGTNTFGKPVGQIALDNTACDDRLRVVAFATQNANRQGNYFNGLATVMEATCRAGDDLNFPLGDPREASVAAALTFLRGGSCTPITASASREAVSLAAPQELLSPQAPNTAQREVPGLF